MAPQTCHTAQTTTTITNNTAHGIFVLFKLAEPRIMCVFVEFGCVCVYAFRHNNIWVWFMNCHIQSKYVNCVTVKFKCILRLQFGIFRALCRAKFTNTTLIINNYHKYPIMNIPMQNNIHFWFWKPFSLFVCAFFVCWFSCSM